MHQRSAGVAAVQFDRAVVLVVVLERVLLTADRDVQHILHVVVGYTTDPDLVLVFPPDDGAHQRQRDPADVRRVMPGPIHDTVQVSLEGLHVADGYWHRLASLA